MPAQFCTIREQLVKSPVWPKQPQKPSENRPPPPRTKPTSTVKTQKLTSEANDKKPTQHQPTKLNHHLHQPYNLRYFFILVATNIGAGNKG
jgi:hypothetical protein